MTPFVFVGTPTTKQLVHAGFHRSLVRAICALAASGVKVAHGLQEGYDVAQQRDKITADFLASGASHLAMIDDDMDYDANLLLKLLSFEKEFVGVVCPWRSFDLDKIQAFVKAGHSAADALDLSHHFNAKGVKWPPVGELFEVQAIGAGIVLIARSVFERMMSETVVHEYKTHPDKVKVKCFWHRDLGPDAELQPEDWSFCFRYGAIGGKMWGYPYADIRHHGYYAHTGNFAKHLKAVSDLPKE